MENTGRKFGGRTKDVKWAKLEGEKAEEVGTKTGKR